MRLKTMINDILHTSMPKQYKQYSSVDKISNTQKSMYKILVI